jgi:flagellar biosynthesis/type III secretory pathway M-ring protein FliF/YscJ
MPVMPTLAQAADRLADAGLQGALLIFVILLISLTGLLAIILLLVMWRRYNARLSASRAEQELEQQKSQGGDPWAAAGQRLAAPDEGDGDGDEGSADDQDDKPRER